MKKIMIAAAAVFVLASFTACNDSQEVLGSLQAVTTTIEPVFVEHIRESSIETMITADEPEPSETSERTVQTSGTAVQDMTVSESASETGDNYEYSEGSESEDVFDDRYFESEAAEYEYTNVTSEEEKTEKNPIYIKTAAVPDDAYEYALKMFSGISKSELLYMGFTPDEAKSAVMGDGYRIKPMEENMDADNIFYFPVLCDGNITAMLTVTYNGEQYGYQFGKDDSLNVMNRLREGVLATSFENPAEIYVSKNATYCVFNDCVMVLAFGSSYSEDKMSEEAEFLGTGRNDGSLASENDIIVVY